MGLALGDYDNDGRVDTFITNFSDDSNTLRRNLGDGLFEDATGRLRLRTPSMPFLGWGAGFLDYDNDGWHDLFVANGHVYPQVDRYDWGMTWAQRPLLFRNRDGARFDEVQAATGCGLAVVRRRAAQHSAISTTTAVSTSWSTIRTTARRCSGTSPRPATGSRSALAGDARVPRDAIGAVVTLEAGSRRLRRDVVSGSSYCSQSDLRAHFGLGETSRRGPHRGTVARRHARGVHRSRRRSDRDADEGVRESAANPLPGRV